LHLRKNKIFIVYKALKLWDIKVNELNIVGRYYTDAYKLSCNMHKECLALNINLLSLLLIVLLSACGASQPPPYQKDRTPEDRNQYSGAEGLTQQQKDQTYLMDKELSDKCTEAKIDLAIAEADKNASEITKQSDLISSTCI
jgi:hypothetical protein